MKALRIHEHGGPEVLRYEDVADPTPGPGQVLVKILAASVNHLDLWVRRGMPGFPVAFPRILGCDAIGEIAGVGEGVTAFSEGQRVVCEPGYLEGGPSDELEGFDHLAADYSIRGEHGDGYDAELVVLDQSYVFPLPSGLDPIQAAAVPLVFLTAYGMVERVDPGPEDTCLVLAGTSGVGSALIQLAKRSGARVISTAGSDAKRQLCSDLGADEVLDHGDPEWPKRVKQLTDGEGCDVVFEHVGPATWEGSMRSLARLGRLVTCGGTTGPKVSMLLPHLFIKNLTILGSTMGPASALPGIFSDVARGRLRPVLDSAVPLSEARSAHERLEARDVLGKLVLVPGA